MKSNELSKLWFLTGYLSVVILVFSELIGGQGTPEVEVNYLPKKQWKMSKHDMSDLKLDIERELRAKILQMQIDWKNKERMEDYMIQNQRFSVPSIVPPSATFPAYPNNYGMSSSMSSMNVYPNGINPLQQQININRLEKKLDNVIKTTESKMGKANTYASQQQEDLDILAKKLTMVQSLHDSLKFTQKEPTSDINQLKHESQLNSILNKYSSNSAVKQIKVFEEAFKGYNSTSHSVNAKEIIDKIEQFTKNGNMTFDNRLEENQKSVEKAANQASNLQNFNQDSQSQVRTNQNADQSQANNNSDYTLNSDQNENFHQRQQIKAKNFKQEFMNAGNEDGPLTID